MLVRIRKNLIPYLMSCITVCTFLSVYTPWIPLVAVLVMALSVGVFAFCDYVGASAKRHPLYLLVMFAVIAAAGYVFRVSGTSMMFIVLEADFTPSAFFTLLILCCFFVGSGIFYFSRVQFRPYALLLLVLLPCTIYARIYLLIPIIYVALEIAIYFILLVDCRSFQEQKAAEEEIVENFAENFNISINKWALIVLAAGIFAVVMVMPKPTQTPYDQFRTYMMEGLTSQSQRLGDSSPTASQNSNRVLFRVEAEEPLYLDLEVLNAYRNGAWGYDMRGELGEWNRIWSIFSRNIAPVNVWKLIWSAGQKDSDFAEKYDVLQMAPPGEVGSEKSARIIHAGFPTTLVPHPQHTYEIDGLSELGVMRNQLGEMQIAGNRSVAYNARYSLQYLSGQKQAENVLAAFFEDFNDDEYALFLDELERVFRNDRNSMESVDALKQDFHSARLYAETSISYASDQLTNLAASITEDLDGGYRKAEAITTYFHQNGFIYDMEFEVPTQYRGDMDYFVFQSKTGTCASYATAMVMMSRSVGLNVRYVRGFYAGNEESPGIYQVTAMHYHAYPQVYLYGLGWTTFEPTVSYEATVSTTSSVLENHEIMTIALGIAVATGGIGYLFWLWAGPAFRELRFKRRLKNLGSQQAVLQLYDRVCGHLEKQTRHSVDSLTTAMVRKRVLDLCGADLQELIRIYEEAAFAGKIPDEEEQQEAFKIYYKAYRALRKQKFLNLLQKIGERKWIPLPRART